MVINVVVTENKYGIRTLNAFLLGKIQGPEREKERNQKNLTISLQN